MHHPTVFVTPVVEHWMDREIAQWVHHMKDRSDDPSHHERTPLPQSYISLPSFLLIPNSKRNPKTSEIFLSKGNLWLYYYTYNNEEEGHVLFNDTPNTFYLWLNLSDIIMVINHSDSERGNPLLPLHGLFFPISSKGSFICTIIFDLSLTGYEYKQLVIKRYQMATSCIILYGRHCVMYNCCYSYRVISIQRHHGLGVLYFLRLQNHLL